MIDRFGRTIDYLRISVTDRCNLRCVYCMPEEGVESMCHEEILTFDEIERICRVMAEMGLKKVKLTGGEPLVRKDFPELVKRLKALPGIEQVTITTNGILLKEMLPGLVEAGVDAVNISLDTVDPELFHRVTRIGDFSRVEAGMKAALESGLKVKINCVPVTSEKENFIRIAAIARDYPVHVRFIEIMPIGFGKQYQFHGEAEIRKELEEEYGKFMPYVQKLGNGPSHYFSVPGFKGKIGFISAISHKFCEECNRVRLTADGFLKTCLQYDIGSQLRDVMRAGCTDEELKELIRHTIDMKPMSHHFLEEAGDDETPRSMSQIGG